MGVILKYFQSKSEEYWGMCNTFIHIFENIYGECVKFISGLNNRFQKIY
jgi:hypothetical protein